MLISSIFFLLGSIEQSASQVFRELVLGRVLVGLGVGMASMVIPIYLAECAPSDLRGRIVGSNSALVTGGQVTAYAISAAFYHLPHSWRWMVLTGAPPALAQLVGLWALDESPRWLLHQGKHAQARRALARMYPSANDDQIEEQLKAFELSSSSSEQQEQDERRTGLDGVEGIAALVGRSSPGGKDGAQGIRQLLADRSARKALLLACGLQASQQLVGANSILYFSSRLLQMCGFVANPNLAALGVALANFVGTLIALRLVDRLGRRRLLLGATAACSIALAALAFSIGRIRLGDVTDGRDVLKGTMTGASSSSESSVASLLHGRQNARDQESPGPWAYASLAAMTLFIFCYALGLGIIPVGVMRCAYPLGYASWHPSKS
ncbi:Predicted transporter (major facilitator superfamily) [Ceraceosorus bombacis]|uniref:Predicted transporter (Major facilitator superfamily) n=1 Tax=Ceraceosorus bombacis TaxID=401625 RepID=A0A0P1BGU9_9BASI|nr:Predicted transporter (major facilitator superfamily) [Ceraceosorus bombacis]